MRALKIVIVTCLLGAGWCAGILWVLVSDATELKEACGSVQSITVVRDGFNGVERLHVALRIDGQERVTDLVITWTEYHNTVVEERNCFMVEAWQLMER